MMVELLLKIPRNFPTLACALSSDKLETAAPNFTVACAPLTQMTRPGYPYGEGSGLYERAVALGAVLISVPIALLAIRFQVNLLCHSVADSLDMMGMFEIY